MQKGDESRLNATTVLVDSHVEEGRADRTAILYRDQRITYGEMAAMVNRTGNALLELGVVMEQRVLLLLLDCPEFIYTFFGAIKIGAVPVPTNTMLQPKDYEYIVNDSRARVLVVSEELLPQIASVRSNFRYVSRIVVAGRAEGGEVSFSDLVAGASPELEPADTGRDDAAFWLYSSGSTGAPKGAVHLQHDMIYAADHYAKNVLQIGPDDVCYSVARLFFAYGLGNASYFPFRVGATTVLVPDRPLPETIFEAVQRYRPTLFFGVPTAYNNMLQIADAEKKYDFSSVRLCASAGEALPETLYNQWFERFRVEILDGIGSTEMLHIFISNRSGSVRPGSSGTPVPGYEARVVDENGNDVPKGDIGTLLVKGDSAAACYWNKHEKTKQTMLGEWLNTGDKYYQDEEGYFWYAGRGDDMLKVGGIWVSPIEVENTLIEHPAVREAAVIGAEDEEGLVKTMAFVVPADGYETGEALVEELQLYVKKRIAPYKYPRWIHFVDELPKTATGKIQRYRLRQSVSRAA